MRSAVWSARKDVRITGVLDPPDPPPDGHNPFGDNDWVLTLEKNRSLGLMNSDLETTGGGDNDSQLK
jgi:hypothetical protein